ncbi:MAG: hypothetical protein ACM31H_06455 [Nitrososphaerales archaeon]
MLLSVANRLSISEDNQVLKKVSPEARYQEYKSQWYFHKSSWYRRNNGQGSYDGIGCNQFTGCIPECKFYNSFGMLNEHEGFD